jgi:hypothetical protein
MTVQMKKGDRLPVLRAALQGPDGAALDLTGASVTFRMKPVTGGALKVNASCAIIGDPTQGIVQYTWGATDTDTVGQFNGEFSASIGGLPLTVPSNNYLLITVEPSLA